MVPALRSLSLPMVQQRDGLARAARYVDESKVGQNHVEQSIRRRRAQILD